MVGKLAKWLRVLGYDTLYQPFYPRDVMDRFLREGRILLTRQRKKAERFGDKAILIHGNQIQEQLSGLTQVLHIAPPRSAWFTRCLRCNTVLKQASEDEAREKIPEYVFYQNTSGIRICPTCGRYFWPGSHRARMENQLTEWGFPLDH